MTTIVQDWLIASDRGPRTYEVLGTPRQVATEILAAQLDHRMAAFTTAGGHELRLTAGHLYLHD